MRRILVLSLVALMGLGALSVPDVALAGRDNGKGQSELARVRQATAKYHNEQAAIDAGYVRTDHCVEDMGYHYVNLGLLFDGIIDAEQPEFLLFAPTSDGRRLVAVEYLIPEEHTDDHPELFGTKFDGPMPEHEPGTTGDHYDLHAWIWSNNPDGILATFNPRVDC